MCIYFLDQEYHKKWVFILDIFGYQQQNRAFAIWDNSPGEAGRCLSVVAVRGAVCSFS